MGDKELIGVKGWLKFFVIWLSVLSIVGAIASYSQFWIAEIDNPYITTVRKYHNYKIVFLVVIILSVSMKSYAAYLLYSQHEESSVKFAKYAIWIAGPVASAFISIFSIKLNYGPLLGENIKYTFVNIIGASIWTFYLNKSVRVYNTYFTPIKMRTVNKDNDDMIYSASANDSYWNVLNSAGSERYKEHFDQSQNPVAESQGEIIVNSNDSCNNSNVINEDNLYLQATQEVDENNQDKALWAKCMALCEGDESKAKYKYIIDRVDRLRHEKIMEMEEVRKQESTRREEIRKFENFNKRLDIYLNGKDTRALRKLLRNNKYDYDQTYHGGFILRQGKEVKLFDTQIEFYDYLRQILPQLNGFNEYYK